MPVQPVISLEQIVIIIAFLMMLFALMWFVRRHRGGITSRIHADRRMQYIEDLSLAPQQRLHLIEVDPPSPSLTLKAGMPPACASAGKAGNARISRKPTRPQTRRVNEKDIGIICRTPAMGCCGGPARWLRQKRFLALWPARLRLIS